jgi:transcriptional regulator with XRE-family HTH domain
VYHRVVYQSIRLDDPQFATDVGRVIREARVLVGWTQAELAVRAATAQSRISRLESDGRADLDVSVLARVLSALGCRGSLEVSDRALDDRRQQRDPVHARVLGYVAQRLSRHGWTVQTEVPIGHPVPRGWIDLVAFRELDAAGLIGEIKGDLPDIGGLQRQVGFYERAHRACSERVAGIQRGSASWLPPSTPLRSRRGLLRTERSWAVPSPVTPSR